jgi:hypothetical protein
MKTKTLVKSVQLLFLILMACSCSNIKREGLPQNERNYAKIDKKIPNTELEPSDMKIALRNSDRKDVFQAVLFLTDSVFGKGFETELKHSDFEAELEEYLFRNIAKFENKAVKLDKRNLMHRSEEYFNSDSITPFTNFENFIGFNDDEFIYETSIGGYDLTYKIEKILAPDWERIGTYKQVYENDQRKTILTLFGYDQTINFVINLTAKDNEKNKTEYYQKVFSDKCVHYTSMNFTTVEFLMDHLNE